MNFFDKIFSGITIGFIIFITITCLFWWTGYFWKLNIIFTIICGIITGTLTVIITLKKHLINFYNFNFPTLFIIFLLYSIGIFGFFMGVPVFNIIPGILAAIFTGRKMKLENKTEAQFMSKLRQTNIFSSAFLLIICGCSAYLALNDPYTSANLKGMLNLKYNVTQSNIIRLIAAGGTALLIAQYFLSVIFGTIAFKK